MVFRLSLIPLRIPVDSTKQEAGHGKKTGQKNNNQKKLHQRKMRKLELRSVGRNITVQTNNTICSELKNDKDRI